jgi:hypothetical protein
MKFELRDDCENDIWKKFGYHDTLNLIAEKRKAEIWAAIADILQGKKSIHFYNGKIEIR